MTVQWGILSTAHINRRIIPAIMHSLRGNLLGVASRDLNKAKDYAGQWQIPKAYGTYEDLLTDSEIDIVYIPLPNHLHTEWIIKSLDAGKHVLCEKPMCLSLEELEMVKDASQRTGLCVMEGFMHLHHPQTKLWKSIIDTGVLGDIHTMQSNFTFNFDRDPGNYRWKPEAGGGALWDVGVYPISLFQYLYGNAAISGTSSMYVENGIDLSTTALLDHGKGRTGQFFVSFRTSYSTHTIIQGHLGQLIITHPFNIVDNCQAIIRRGSKDEYLDVPRQYLYSGEVKNMHDVILEGKSPLISLDQSRDVLKTIQLLKSKT